MQGFVKLKWSWPTQPRRSASSTSDTAANDNSPRNNRITRRFHTICTPANLVTGPIVQSCCNQRALRSILPHPTAARWSWGGSISRSQVLIDQNDIVSIVIDHRKSGGEGLPMQLVVHSAAIQARDGAELVIDKMRRRFPWFERPGRWISRSTHRMLFTFGHLVRRVAAVVDNGKSRSIEDLDFINRLERFGRAGDGAPPLRNEKFADSALEIAGFEPSVPRRGRRHSQIFQVPLISAAQVIAVTHTHLDAGPPWFSLSSPALRATPSSPAGARFEQVVACCAGRRLRRTGGKTQIYLRSSSARPAIR